MARKTKKVSDAKAQPTLTENEPQPTLTEEKAAAEKPTTKDRNAHGQFAKGNSGGPGNPHARACARMLEVFRNAVSEEDMIRIVTKLVEKAAAGDASAAKIIVSYRIGKPLPAHHPDSIDRDEWDHYQKDAMDAKEMGIVMNALPTRVGNDIARISLPIMTAARTHDLAMQLREGCPAPESPTAPETDLADPDDCIAQSATQAETGKDVKATVKKQDAKTPPLPNGKKNKASDSRSKVHTARSTAQQPSTRHTPPATTKEPLPNGKKMDGKKIRKKLKPSWLQPLAKQVQGG
jgi:hypothetical protein